MLFSGGPSYARNSKTPSPAFPGSRWDGYVQQEVCGGIAIELSSLRHSQNLIDEFDDFVTVLPTLLKRACKRNGAESVDVRVFNASRLRLNDEAVSKITEQLMRNVASPLVHPLRVLKLHGNRITDQGIFAISEWIRLSQAGLEELHLGHNLIGTEGAVALSVSVHKSMNYPVRRQILASQFEQEKPAIETTTFYCRIDSNFVDPFQFAIRLRAEDPFILPKFLAEQWNGSKAYGCTIFNENYDKIMVLPWFGCQYAPRDDESGEFEVERDQSFGNTSSSGKKVTNKIAKPIPPPEPPEPPEHSEAYTNWCQENELNAESKGSSDEEDAKLEMILARAPLINYEQKSTRGAKELRYSQAMSRKFRVNVESGHDLMHWDYNAAWMHAQQFKAWTNWMWAQS